jgi:hypothetical protein
MVVVDYGRLATAESWRTLALIRAGIPPRHLNSKDAVPACNVRILCATVTPTGRCSCMTARNSAICYCRLLAYGTEACECSGAGHERGALAIAEWRTRSSNPRSKHHVTVVSVLEYLLTNHWGTRPGSRVVRCLRQGRTTRPNAQLYLLLVACDPLVHFARGTANTIPANALCTAIANVIHPPISLCCDMMRSVVVGYMLLLFTRHKHRVFIKMVFGHSFV